MDLSISFILSILSGLIANYISSKLDTMNKLDFNIEPKIIFQNISNENDEIIQNKIREQNSKILRNHINSFIFYVISFILIGASFFYPIFFHFGINQNLDLNKTKLSIDFILNRDNFILASTIFAFIFYIPVLFISKKIAYLFSLVLTNFQKITNRKLITMRIIAILFLAIFIAANIYWIINIHISWWDAIKKTFLFILFIFMIGAGS